MKTCPQCGVYVEDEEPRCPLCYTPLDGPEEGEGETGGEPASDMPDARPRFWLMEVVSLLAAVGAIVVFAADFAFGFALSWSPVPLASIVYGWAVVMAAVGLGRRGLPLGLALTGLTLGYLAVLDALTGDPAWFVGLGLPLVLLGALVAGGTVWQGLRRGVSTLPAVALSLVGAGLYAVGVELIVRLHAGGGLRVSWSVVVLACAISLALVVVLIHRRLRRRHTSLERIFHL